MTIAEQRREAQRMIEIEALFEYETFKDKGRDFLTALEKVPYIGLIFCPNWSKSAYAAGKRLPGVCKR